jgi:N-acetylglucosaminyldiphosphoundecaprenol N-acetyl-beta-D-mannosaminyltransferase
VAIEDFQGDGVPVEESGIAQRCHLCQPAQARQKVNSVEIDPLDEQTFLSRLDQFVQCGESHVVHFIPADPTVRARADLSYRNILNEGDLNVPDGMAVVWAMRLIDRRTKRLPGSDAMLEACNWSQENGYGHFFYGGKPHILNDLQAELEQLFPEMQVVGTESPPFRTLSKAEIEKTANVMRQSGAQFVWVGLGTPKQDLVAAELRKYSAAPVVLCVGAAFDFVARAKSRAPNWMQGLGLEWLFRLVSEPSRLWKRYMIGNPKFVAGVFWDAITTKFLRAGS